MDDIDLIYSDNQSSDDVSEVERSELADCIADLERVTEND
jgi:hypothetical protein